MKRTHHVMTDDMYQLMGERVSKAIRDTAHTCQIGGMEAKDILEIAASIILHELIRTAVATRCDRNEFLQLCVIGWDSLAEQFLKDYEDD